MNRKKFVEYINNINEIIMGLCDDLETVAGEIEDLENNEFIDTANFKIPGHVYSMYDSYKPKIKKWLIWCVTECNKDETEDADLIDYIASLQNAFDKLEKTYHEYIDDSSIIYDVISDLQLPIEDLQSIFEDDWKIKEDSK